MRDNTKFLINLLSFYKNKEGQILVQDYIEDGANYGGK
jgi:hypothetical protein